jgi:thioredoxin:protein disulfide reductase
MDCRRITIVLALLTVVLTACASAPGWIDDTIAAAAKQKKPLIVEFYARWCKPCRHFEEQILTDPRVQAALANVVFVRYDIEAPAGKDAYARCQGQGIPLVVGIDGQGNIRLAKTGTESTPDEFLQFLGEAQVVLGAAYR